MNEAQRDGRACVVCGAEADRMVPAGWLDHVQVFRCDPDCRETAQP